VVASIGRSQGISLGILVLCLGLAAYEVWTGKRIAQNFMPSRRTRQTNRERFWSHVLVKIVRTLLLAYHAIYHPVPDLR
jgi:hypothetical protein